MKTCCFTGHRELSIEQSQIIIPNLSHAIKQAIESGCDTFISGFAQGFDLLSAKLVLAQKKEYYPFLSLWAYIPHQQRLYTKDIEFQSLIEQCDCIKVISKQYYRACFLKRNEKMVDDSNHVIACYDYRGKGGTYQTIQYAQKQQKSITIIPISLI